MAGAEVLELTQGGGQLPDFSGALDEGFLIRGFRSGGGLRVIRIENPAVLEPAGDDVDGVTNLEPEMGGYGEAPHVEEALTHAHEAFQAGGRSYQEQYSGDEAMYTHYLTGESSSSSPLDGHLLQGRSFNARKIDDKVVVELRGRLLGLGAGVAAMRGSGKSFQEAVDAAFQAPPLPVEGNQYGIYL